MIPVVLKSLRDHGLLNHGADPELQVTLTSGDSIHLFVFEDARLKYFVKCSKHVPLNDEYERHTWARRTHGAAVSLPCVFIRSNGWDIIAAEGVTARPLRRAELFGKKVTAHLTSELEAFCVRQARLSEQTDSLDRTGRLIRQLRELLSADSLAPVRDCVLSESNCALLQSLPRIPQHGDFVVNNLGWVHRKLMVFDYEDFGRLHVPGFDLTTLYGSLYLFEPAPLLILARASETEVDRLVPWLRPCCSAHGLSLATFRSLLPIHLAAFVLLRTNYSLVARRIAERALIEFAASSNG